MDNHQLHRFDVPDLPKKNVINVDLKDQKSVLSKNNLKDSNQNDMEIDVK